MIRPTMTPRVACLMLIVVVAAALATAMAPGSGATQTTAGPAGLKEVSLQHDGQQRWFQVQEPQLRQRPAAVVVLLHGGTQSMRKIFQPNAGGSRGWLRVAAENNILLLAPNATNARTGDTKGDFQIWNDLRFTESDAQARADDVGFILAMLDWAERSYAIDRRRVYVTGASNGGWMTMRLLIEASDRFAAGAAFISTLPDASTPIRQPARPTPLLLVNGTEDPLVKWAGGAGPFNRGRTRSVPDTVAWWIKANRASVQPATDDLLPDLDPRDGCRIQRSLHPASGGGREAAPVHVYTMRGGGHAMPSRQYPIPDTFVVRRLIGPVCKDAEGADLAWEFLSQFNR